MERLDLQRERKAEYLQKVAKWREALCPRKSLFIGVDGGQSSPALPLPGNLQKDRMFNEDASYLGP